MENEKVLVVGFSTGSKDIETWRFDNDELCQRFCQMLVNETGRRVWIIKGEIIGRYEFADLPVVFKEGNGIVEPPTTNTKQ